MFIASIENITGMRYTKTTKSTKHQPPCLFQLVFGRRVSLCSSHEPFKFVCKLHKMYDIFRWVVWGGWRGKRNFCLVARRAETASRTTSFSVHNRISHVVLKLNYLSMSLILTSLWALNIGIYIFTQPVKSHPVVSDVLEEKVKVFSNQQHTSQSKIIIFVF